MIDYRPMDTLTDWVSSPEPFMLMRLNDDVMIHVLRWLPEGQLMSDETHVNYAQGDDFGGMFAEWRYLVGTEKLPARFMIGSSWTEEADALSTAFVTHLWDKYSGLDSSLRWCSGHPLMDGVTENANRGEGGIFLPKTILLLEALRASERRICLVGCETLTPAKHFFADQKKGSGFIWVPRGNSWKDREATYLKCRSFAVGGYTFVWCAGSGCKTTAWKLWRDFPQSSHLDAGHLFDAAIGPQDANRGRGWQINTSHPWYKPYFETFAPYVRKYLIEETA